MAANRRAAAQTSRATAKTLSEKCTWQHQENRLHIRVLPGEYYVTDSDEAIMTVLGSCVSTCIRDPASGCGGMNHFLLPSDSVSKDRKPAPRKGLVNRFGLEAMESLVADIAALGGDVENLEVKVFGGANLLNMTHNEIGNKNIRFVRKFIAEKGYKLLAEDLGGEHPRKIIYTPSTGAVMVRRLRSLQNNAVVNQENSWQNAVSDRLKGHHSKSNRRNPSPRNTVKRGES